MAVRALVVTATLAMTGAASLRADPGPRDGVLAWPAAMASRFDVRRDTVDYATDATLDLKRFPGASVQWVVADDAILPTDASVRSLDHPGWDLAFQPGTWQAADENGRRTLRLPFALVEKRANCTHNGVLDLAFTGDTVSRAHYEINAETCAYFQFDMAGDLAAAFTPAEAPDATAVVAARRRQLAARLPVLPIERLAEDYPGFDLAVFDRLPPDDLSVYGFVIDGRHYRSPCRTRAGDYPFCADMLLPSYSTAKSIFAALALMRLEALAPGAADRSLAELVPDCRDAGWDDVSIGDALDMATGHYRSVAPDADEAAAANVDFLYLRSHAERIRFACHHYPRVEPAGHRFVYHSSDTYLAGAAMQALLDRLEPGNHGLYASLVVEPFWQGLDLSPALNHTLATADARPQPNAGWGLFYTADDIARIGVWLNAGAPGPAALDRHLLAAALQRDPRDPGVVAGEDLRYNNGFWAYDVAAAVACDHAVYVPFMSGYGGIAVVLMPNRTVYYYFGDGYEQRWRDVARASHRLRSLCS